MRNQSYGRWTLVAFITACCFLPRQLAAQDSFAGTKAGEERGFFCWCPPGKFKMGDDQVDATRTRGFWMGKHEVTQAQYQFVMGKNPSEFKGVSLPVETVSWNDATECCQKLTKMEREAGRLPQGWECRLPTEAQWEYACRAGTTTVYSFGDDPKQLGDYAWYISNSIVGTHPVGEKNPNAWGLCDMHGNVWEWCQDGYQDKLPGGTDPEVTNRATRRVIRGGGWLYDAGRCRSASRDADGPGYRSRDLGFRLAAVPTSQQAKNE